MGTRTRVQAVGLMLAASIGLTACNGDAEEPTPASQPAPSTSESAPVTQPPPPDDDEQTTTAEPELSAEEQDQADIKETLQLYTGALSSAFNGDDSVEGIYPFSRDTAREKWVTEVMAAEAQGVTFSGQMEVEVIEVLVDGQAAEVVACLDVSAVEAVDENGNSILAEDRLDQTLQDYVLQRDDSAEQGWYIVEDTNRNEPCDG
ncbi:alpha/beta hydrolase family protein [Ornithinimicrobium sp. F0845]|uniref:alpha/beta hydrolase family protein n=1 Tax=Ornithinimicrobium sp. F0845 TaxID=2926412 RepID=UPI001FF4AA0C|nr:alpha/beta hydrolase family protein [Ornithinimicrobium sp. F0845]MCK0113539.1 alpha/beta hydrolase family protein [Ornithinimicrobium sp. F0845]